MKKLNKKGFTLIELLAVIVVLAIIMVIATNSITAAMSKARASAFSDTALNIKKEIKNRIAIGENDLLSGSTQVTCVSGDAATNCEALYDISKNDYTLNITNIYCAETGGAVNLNSCAASSSTTYTKFVGYQVVLAVPYASSKFSGKFAAVNTTTDCPVNAVSTVKIGTADKKNACTNNSTTKSITMILDENGNYK